VSPARRRRTGDPSFDVAKLGLDEPAGTAFIGESDEAATATLPEEPEWMRDAAGDVSADPTVPVPEADPKTIAAKRKARAAEIVKALIKADHIVEKAVDDAAARDIKAAAKEAQQSDATEAGPAEAAKA